MESFFLGAVSALIMSLLSFVIRKVMNYFTSKDDVVFFEASEDEKDRSKF